MNNEAARQTLREETSNPIFPTFSIEDEYGDWNAGNITNSTPSEPKQQPAQPKDLHNGRPEVLSADRWNPAQLSSYSKVPPAPPPPKLGTLLSESERIRRHQNLEGCRAMWEKCKSNLLTDPTTVPVKSPPANAIDANNPTGIASQATNIDPTAPTNFTGTSHTTPTSDLPLVAPEPKVQQKAPPIITDISDNRRNPDDFNPWKPPGGVQVVSSEMRKFNKDLAKDPDSIIRCSECCSAYEKDSEMAPTGHRCNYCPTRGKALWFCRMKCLNKHTEACKKEYDKYNEYCAQTQANQNRNEPTPVPKDSDRPPYYWFTPDEIVCLGCHERNCEGGPKCPAYDKVIELQTIMNNEKVNFPPAKAPAHQMKIPPHLRKLPAQFKPPPAGITQFTPLAKPLPSVPPIPKAIPKTPGIEAKPKPHFDGTNFVAPPTELPRNEVHKVATEYRAAKRSEMQRINAFNLESHTLPNARARAHATTKAPNAEWNPFTAAEEVEQPKSPLQNFERNEMSDMKNRINALNLEMGGSHTHKTTQNYQHSIFIQDTTMQCKTKRQSSTSKRSKRRHNPMGQPVDQSTTSMR